MPYKFKDFLAPAAETQRIAEEQLARAIAEIEDTSLSSGKTVHQVRKRCKKLRGLLRLARGPLDRGKTFSQENAWYRDTAGALSGMRDAEVLIETFDKLTKPNPDIDGRHVAPVRRKLTKRLRAIAEDESVWETRLDEARDRLDEGRRRVPEWAGVVTGFAELENGLGKTYRRGRKALKALSPNASGEAFHEWRKRVKNHGYHIRLLEKAWPEVLRARASEVSRLGDLLGDEHDLSIFSAILLDESEDLGDPAIRAELVVLARERQEQLRAEALRLGPLVYAEKTSALVKRVAKLWSRTCKQQRKRAKEPAAA
ncbi:MAG: CHAD domain-containing protein [Opitutales bacterium]